MKIYQWFIPTKKNKFHPIALRSAGLMIFLAIFITIPFLYNIVSAKKFQVLGYATNVNVTDLFNLSNQERINAGLAPLSLNSELNNAAQAKANDMMAKDYWAHISPDGLTPWVFITNAGYQYTAAGENLAKNFDTSSGAVAGWMGSPTHRDNVLSPNYKDVGYAVLNGVLQGEQTTLVVAEYGARAEPIVASTAPAQINNTQPATTAPKQAETNQVANTSQSTENTTAEPTAATQVQTTTTSSTSQPINQGITASKTTNTQNNSGSVEGAAISLPIRTYNSLNWGQKASLLLLSTLILLFIMKHTLIWREQKRGFKHIWLRSHPLGQVAVLTVVMVFTILSGVGVVL